MKRLLMFLKPYKRQVIFLMILYALQTACALFMPYVMGNIVDFGIKLDDISYVWTSGALMVGLAVVEFLLALATNKLSSVLTAKYITDIRRSIFNKVNSLSFEQFSEFGTGSLITRTTEDIGWMTDTISSIPYLVVSVPIMFIGGVVLSMLGDWTLALILLGASLLVLFVASIITANIDKAWQRSDEFTDIQNRIIRERLSGIRVIRAFDKESYEHGRADYATTEMCKCYVRSNRMSQLVDPVCECLLNLATVLVIYIGATRLGNVATLRAGTIISVIQYVALIINAILMLSWTFSFVPHVKVGMGRINQVLDMPVQEDVKSDGRKLEGTIDFRNVSFAYYGSDHNVITDVDFHADNGEIVGIIGGTGCGKSTLGKLIMNFYTNVSGTRTFGGVDYNDVTPATIRDNVSVALQKSMIFEGTIEDNIKMGNHDATPEQVNQVVEMSQLSKFVARVDDGLQYKLTQSGNNVSGGQKQRINIARALLKPASVYIFDDSFSALDYLTEANLRKAVNKYLDGKTQIIITQRVATAMRCDKVYVMDCGRVVGVGTHKQLLSSCNIYREIYHSQLGGDDDEQR